MPKRNLGIYGEVRHRCPPGPEMLNRAVSIDGADDPTPFSFGAGSRSSPNKRAFAHETTRRPPVGV
jgi:hypothetical protein